MPGEFDVPRFAVAIFSPCRMYAFHTAVHALPPDARPGPVVMLRGQPLPSLMLPTGSAARAFDVSFEEAAAALARLDQLFFEPDGSFVWTSGVAAAIWQVEGVLYDLHGRLRYAEIHGRCPAEQFDLFLTALGWPAMPLVFQLLHEAVFLDEARFRDYAQRG